MSKQAGGSRLFSNLTISVAAIGLAIVLLQVFLGDRQKAALHGWVINRWYWLSEARKRSLLDQLHRHSQLIVGAALAVATSYIVWNLLKLRIDARYSLARQLIVNALTSVLIFGAGFWFGIKIVRIILAAQSLIRAGLWATVFVCVAFLPLYILALILPYFAAHLLPMFENPTPTLGIALGQLLSIVVLLISLHFTAISVICWAVVALPLIVIYLFIGLLCVAEFVVRRLAEYPQGPLVAILAIVGGVGLLLKALT